MNIFVTVPLVSASISSFLINTTSMSLKDLYSSNDNVSFFLGAESPFTGVSAWKEQLDKFVNI